MVRDLVRRRICVCRLRMSSTIGDSLLVYSLNRAICFACLYLLFCYLFPGARIEGDQYMYECILASYRFDLVKKTDSDAALGNIIEALLVLGDLTYYFISISRVTFCNLTLCCSDYFCIISNDLSINL